MSEVSIPTNESKRIESLDVLRGFALLGILLLNIIGFGMLSPAYSNPGFDLAGASSVNIGAWMTVELFAEGAMRCLFSILFGAGVILFTDTKSGWSHYKRTFWLLMFGLLDAYILLWSGDILVAYALAGALLFLVRNHSAKSLMAFSASLIVLMSLLHAATGFGLGEAYQAHERVFLAEQNAEPVTQPDLEAAAGWKDFIKDYTRSEQDLLKETTVRTANYRSAFEWNAEKNTQNYLFALPIFLFWDALAMMMLGMALYKTGVLQGARDSSFYLKLMLAGFSAGLLINGYEVSRAVQSQFDIFSTFAQMQPTYHFGRLAMAFGYIGLVVWICKTGSSFFTNRLAAVGKMALTNYLMQSLICALIFTGMGFGLLGQLQRIELYGVVIAIWLFQLWFSTFWLNRYRFGPVEWLWRTLTYGSAPPISR